MGYVQQGGLRLINFSSGGILRRSVFATIAAALALIVMLPFTAAAAGGSNKGFDAYGYNDQARLFVGNCLNWYMGTYPGGSTAAQNYCGVYANDQVVMKWNKAWDDCEATVGQDDASKCAGAWTTNHWNGSGSDGSGEVWHYKIIWVGSEAEESPYWRDGGYSIWGNYEVISDHGTAGGVHSVLTHATPNGLGR